MSLDILAAIDHQKAVKANVLYLEAALLIAYRDNGIVFYGYRAHEKVVETAIKACRLGHTPESLTELTTRLILSDEVIGIQPNELEEALIWLCRFGKIQTLLLEVLSGCFQSNGCPGLDIRKLDIGYLTKYASVLIDGHVEDMASVISADAKSAFEAVSLGLSASSASRTVLLASAIAPAYLEGRDSL